MMLEQSFQAKFLIPMAVSIVFGLAFATGLTLLMIPVLYLVLEDFKAIAASLWPAPSSQEDHAAHADSVQAETAPDEAAPAKPAPADPARVR